MAALRLDDVVGVRSSQFLLQEIGDPFAGASGEHPFVHVFLKR
jgi:hypothetical protein